MEQIQQHIKQRLENFQVEFQESALPTTSFDMQDFLQLSRDEIKEKYKERYLIYRKLKYGSKNLSEIEINDIKKYLRFLNKLDIKINELESGDNFNTHPLRLKMMKGLLTGLELGKTSGYIAAPTQSGKTWAMINLLETLSGIKTFVLCDSQLLVDQTYQRLKESGLDVKVHYGKHKQGLDTDVVVTSYSWFQKALKKGVIVKEDLGFVIADEGHAVLGAEIKKIVSEIIAADVNVLALTASPDFSAKKNLLSFLGHEYCRILIKEGAEQGLIANFKCIFAFTDTDLSDVKFENGEYDNDQYLAAISNEKRMQSVWEYWKAHLQDKKGLIFASRVAYADRVQEYMARRAKEEGLEAKIGVISGDMNLNERKEEKTRWEQGQLRAIASVKAAAQGVSFDDGDYILCLDATCSQVIQIQRCGRSMGVSKARPDRVVEIIEIIDTDRKRGLMNVTFPQVAGTAEVVAKVRSAPAGDKVWVPISKIEQLEKLTRRPEAKKEVAIQGLRIVIDPVEVMKIAKEGQNNYDLAGKLKQVTISPGELMDQIKLLNLNPNKKWYESFVSNPENVKITKDWPLDLNYFLKKNGLPTSLEWFALDLSLEPDELMSDILKINPNPDAGWYKTFVSNPKNQDVVKGWPVGLFSYLTTRGLPSVNEWFGCGNEDGWLTLAELGKKIKIHPATIKNYLNKNKETSNVKEMSDKKGRLFLHVSPETCLEIEAFCSQEYGNREGGVMLSDLQVEIGVDKRTLKKYTKSKGFTGIKFVTLEESEVIRNHFNQRKSPPEGWLSLPSFLQDNPSIKRQVAITLINKNKKMTGLWVDSESKSESIHMSPTLVNLILVEQDVRKFPPENWINMTDLCKKLNVTKVSKRVLDSLKNSSNSGIFVGKNSKLIEHFSPEFVEKIEHIFNSAKPEITDLEKLEIIKQKAKELGLDLSDQQLIKMLQENK